MNQRLQYGLHWGFKAVRKSCIALASATVVLISAGQCVGTNLVTNPGFETGSALLGPRPTTFAEWRGDRVAYVTSENGILPTEGNRMLKFINTEFAPNATDTSQYWQNIDLSPFAVEIASGNARLSASVVVNRVQIDAQTDSAFALQLHIRSGTPASFTPLLDPQSGILADSNLESWEMISLTDIVLPTETTYVMLEIKAFENIFNDTVNPEFDGHYADAVNVSLTVVPEPGAILLSATATISLLAVLVHRHRRRNRAQQRIVVT